MSGKRWMGWAAVACVACCTLPFLIVGAGGLAAISADAWICGSICLSAQSLGMSFPELRRTHLAVQPQAPVLVRRDVNAKQVCTNPKVGRSDQKTFSS
jgi:hypothetical protein